MCVCARCGRDVSGGGGDGVREKGVEQYVRGWEVKFDGAFGLPATQLLKVCVCVCVCGSGVWCGVGDGVCTCAYVCLCGGSGGGGVSGGWW